MKKLLLLLVMTGLVAGCSPDRSWQTKDIAGLMPELEFTLTSETGETVTEEQYLDAVNLMFFGYTHCPDICPVTLSRLRGIMGQLPEEVAGDIRVLFVSVDPDRDDPQSLREYTDAFGESFVGLTGTRDQLDALTKRYRTTYGYGEPDEDGDYLVSHGSAVYAFDADGNPRLLIRDSDSTGAIASDLKQLVQS